MTGSHHTSYGRTVLCYLKNDCSATRTAADLGLHRNTVRNMISMVEERYAVSLDDSEEKMRYILSEQIQEYNKVYRIMLIPKLM